MTAGYQLPRVAWAPLADDPGVVDNLGVPDIRDLDDFLAWLRSLPPLQRARMAKVLANVETSREVRKIGDEAVYELTRDRPWSEVAELLGTGIASINKAVSRHNGVARPRGPRAAE